MILSSILVTFRSVDYYEMKIDPYLSWIGLFNWIPLFFGFWAFQPYLQTAKSRRNCSLILLAGSFPILVGGIFQYFFQVHGPYEFLDGIIVWYQRPIIYHNSGLTGLFNNANYAGAWLNIVWPLCLASYAIKGSYARKVSTFFLLSIICLCIVLTNSRAAWLTLLTSTVLFFGKKFLKWMVPITLFISLIISSSISTILGSNVNKFLSNIIPTNIMKEFTNVSLERIDIWLSSIEILIKRPFFGSGVSAFNKIYLSETTNWVSHSHNLPIELSINYGIIAALFIIIPVIFICIKSYKIIFENHLQNNFFEKAWIISLISLVICHMVDIQYYDARFSICAWILLAGMKNIISQKQAESN